MLVTTQRGSDAFVPGRVEYGDGLGDTVGLIGNGPFGAVGTVVTGGGHGLTIMGANYRPSVMSERTALTLPAFWSGVRFLSETLAQLPVDVCRKVGGVRERLDGHPVETALNVWANDLSTPGVLRETLLAHAIVSGNGYLYIDRDDAGDWTGKLFNLMPDTVRPFRLRGLSGAVEQWYAVFLPGINRPTAVRSADIFHLMGPSPDGMCGYPLVSVMGENLGIAKNAERFGAKFFEQGGHLGGTIETEQKLTDDQIASLRDQINTGHAGIENAHKFILLPNGAKAKTMALPPDTAQYIETRNLAVTDICRMLRVFPYYVMDLQRATWSNAEQQALDTVKFSLSPWIIRLEQQVAAKLLTPGERADGYFAKFNVDALLRGDHVQQLDSTTKRLSAGLTNLDEERAMYDLPPLPDGLGQIRFVPAQWQVLEKPAAPTTPPEVKPPAPDPLVMENANG